MMQLINKIKEVVISVLPITLIVVILNYTIAPLGDGVLFQFIIGALLLIVGLALFLLGTDIGILPMGQLMGSTLIKTKKVPVMLIFSFVIGFMISLTEPDLHVLGEQLGRINPGIPKAMLLIVVSVGVALFVAIGLLRIVFKLSLKKILLIGYVLVFVLAIFSSPYMLPVSFDSGGVTTGPMTVPFIMAFCIGLAHLSSGANDGSDDDNFGLVGLMSLGPIIATLVLGVAFKEDMSNISYVTETAEGLKPLIKNITAEVAVALSPMIITFLVFQFFYLRLPTRRVLRIGLGMAYTYIGLVVFLLGANYGFLPTGSLLGEILAAPPNEWIIIPVGALIGLTIVLAEPAVWVLTQQIESITAGLISKKAMMFTLSIGIAAAVGLAMFRIYTGLNIFWFLVPGYLASLLLMRHVENIFTAIAFDSGGVASGAMASTFVLPFALGACAEMGGNVLTDAFGAVAMIAMVPLIAIQLLGVIFAFRKSKAEAEYAALARIEEEIEAEEEALLRQAKALREQAEQLEQQAAALRQKNAALNKTNGEGTDEENQ